MIDRYHVVPSNDLREHNTDNGVACWCQPEENEDNLIIHNSMDGRERFENGIRKPS
jgi:hypothetical protein